MSSDLHARHRSGSFWTLPLTLPLHLLPLISVGVFLAEMLQSVEVLAASNFTINGEDYVCTENIICFGDAHVPVGTIHVYSGEKDFDGILSLVQSDVFEQGSAGLAYYKDPIRLLDPRTQTFASFNTSFQFIEYPYIDNNTVWPGDGLAFVISADNFTDGRYGTTRGGGYLGYFEDFRLTYVKCVVVEFDNWQNVDLGDINDNHVSIDINNITAAAARNVTELGIYLYNQTTVYVWIEFSASSQVLEVRISKQNLRPSSPFLSHKITPSEAIEEYMWVGFSGGNALTSGAYYVGDWKFEAYGIAAEVSSHKSSRSGRWGSLVDIAVIAVGISAFTATFFLVLVLWLLRKRKGRGRGLWRLEDAYMYSSWQDDSQLHLAQDGYRFTYEELNDATGGFADEAKLGQGGQGSVYRGQLPNCNFLVAVKKISRESLQGEREFRAEVSIVSQLRHRNLIRLLGWCIEDGKYYIVYDLMPNGSLDKVLLPSDSRSTGLSWPQRFKVIMGTAAAVEYLHHGWNKKIIHRDIKASNIMLDEQWNAKLGDFGLARSTNHQQAPDTTLVAGTPGYIAPEAAASGRFTEKSDVFAFGALALEVACGRKALNLQVESEECVLVDWVWRRLSEGHLLSVVDTRLDEYDVEQMETLLLLGLICSHPDPAARPPIRVVVGVLCGEISAPVVPMTKPLCHF